jgi:AAA+ ATPase superfamily predicted ATPase
MLVIQFGGIGTFFMRFRQILSFSFGGIDYYFYLCGQIYKIFTMDTLAGRHEERAMLQRIVESGSPEFLAVYGRRWVGKTFLIKSFFQQKFTFYFSGVENSAMRTQLENFKIAFQNYFKQSVPTPENWTIAFAMLREALSRSRKRGRKVIFIDEMPWLSTNGSGFIQAFEYWWNTYASTCSDILLIVCGSSTSWMLNKLIKSRGGLHNRVTRQMLLEPFTLAECEEYAISRKLSLSRKHIADYYMIIGGVPYYWQQLDKAYGLPQNIDNMFFKKNAVLREEFDKIFNSLFKQSGKYISIVKTLIDKQSGYTREEIVKHSGLSDGGSVTRMLVELEQCGFIRSYSAFGKNRKEKIYQLVDFFSMFHLNFIQNKPVNDAKFWTNNLNSPACNAWSGYSFEQLCLLHTEQIRRKLGIGGVTTYTFSWRSRDREQGGAQIDLVIDRNDRIINLCEMKYSNNEYVITKDYDMTLRRRRGLFIEETKTRKTVHTTLITTYGVKRNEYRDSIQSEVVLDDLF